MFLAVRVVRFDAIGEMVLSRTDPCLAFSLSGDGDVMLTLLHKWQELIGIIVNKFLMNGA